MMLKVATPLPRVAEPCLRAARKRILSAVSSKCFDSTARGSAAGCHSTVGIPRRRGTLWSRDHPMNDSISRRARLRLCGDPLLRLADRQAITSANQTRTIAGRSRSWQERARANAPIDVQAIEQNLEKRPLFAIQADRLKATEDTPSSNHAQLAIIQAVSRPFRPAARGRLAPDPGSDRSAGLGVSNQSNR